MTKIFEADLDDDCEVMTLKDGRVAVAYDGVDHRATPSELAKCINKLENQLKEGQEVVEVSMLDDVLWYAIVPIVK